MYPLLQEISRMEWLEYKVKKHISGWESGSIVEHLHVWDTGFDSRHHIVPPPEVSPKHQVGSLSGALPGVAQKTIQQRSIET